MPENEKWTSEQFATMRAKGQPFRLAFARQTPEQKAQQRDQMRESLNAEQVDHVLHLWKALAHEVQELSRAMQDVRKDLALQIRQLQDQQQHEDTDNHGKPPGPWPRLG